MSTKNYKFETLQLHVGQTLSTQPIVSASVMQVISMVV